MRIKNLRGVSEVQFKKTRLLHLGNVENHPIRNFLRNGRLRVNLLSLYLKFSQLSGVYHRGPKFVKNRPWWRKGPFAIWFDGESKWVLGTRFFRRNYMSFNPYAPDRLTSSQARCAKNYGFALTHR